ncbi:hypothetical protein PPERSA_00169 [Pseudocohnilembus persalinus]|uniref:Uncharacterized protein n=1 Tax=Pseudocohnilembus persalinus TaxID=266149 RepID=A0A0V0QCU6_PSEPJ|nr:hypothetical protein PPERSA_00169 [Pseudocohnilembus persalinus]|eukprot:KRX00019.1 hypothetical protein PPERSA_00169 [Pseudocohnilembus persalinus]
MSQTKFLKARQEDQNLRNDLSKDLRREHFVFGFDKDNTYKTKYGEAMKEHKLEDFKATRQEMENLRKDLRKEHYALGTDKDPKSLFQTSAASTFVKYDNPDRAQLSKDTKNDLRSCHFVLGYNQDPKKSDYKINFGEKNIDQEVFKDRKDQVNALRQHHPVFNDDGNYFSTLYNETTNKQYDPQLLHQGKSKKQIQDQIVELRKTNLLMGTNQPNYISEQQQEFGDKGFARNDLVDIDLKGTNFRLGIDPNQYNTTFKDTFTGQYVAPDKGKTQELLQDLRKEHYSLGNDKANYKSENKRNFVEYTKEQLQDKPDLSELYKSHFRIGGPSQNTNNENRYKSDYKSNYQERDPIQNDSLRNDRTDRCSNIVLGSDKNNDQFVSEAKANMKDFSKDNNRGTVDPKLAKDLRGTHYNFGTDNPEYVTQHQAQFTDKSHLGGKQTLEEALKKDLRRNHFEYGTQSNEYNTTHQEIGKNQGLPSKLDPKLAKELRSHHFVHGIYGNNYDTTYKVSHKDFTKDEFY